MTFSWPLHFNLDLCSSVYFFFCWVTAVHDITWYDKLKSVFFLLQDSLSRLVQTLDEMAPLNPNVMLLTWAMKWMWKFSVSTTWLEFRSGLSRKPLCTGETRLTTRPSVNVSPFLSQQWGILTLAYVQQLRMKVHETWTCMQIKLRFHLHGPGPRDFMKAMRAAMAFSVDMCITNMFNQ